jgi:hypothetical protein
LWNFPWVKFFFFVMMALSSLVMLILYLPEAAKPVDSARHAPVQAAPVVRPVQEDTARQSYIRTLPDQEVKRWLRTHKEEVSWIDAEMFEWNHWIWRKTSSNYWIGEWTGAPKS